MDFQESTTNYLELPSPVKYEDMQREVMSKPLDRSALSGVPMPDTPAAGVVALKPELFEGLRFEVNRPLTQNIFLAHR